MRVGGLGGRGERAGDRQEKRFDEAISIVNGRVKCKTYERMVLNYKIFGRFDR